MNVLLQKFKEVIIAVLPITIIVLILNFTAAPIGTELIWKFVIGALFIIFGLTIFLFGTEIGVQPIGQLMGSTLAKKRNVWLIVIFGFILGFLINAAEPDLQVLARQVGIVTGGDISQLSIIIAVSIGVGILVMMGMLRIIFGVALNRLLTILYMLILVLGIFSPEGFLGISFDAGGATTGSMTVPFILALGLGISSTQGGKKSEEDSFGLLGLASAGPMIALPLMGIIFRTEIVSDSLTNAAMEYKSIFHSFLYEIPPVTLEVTMALLPLLIMFFIFQGLYFNLAKKEVFRILKGLLYTFIGFVLFLVGVNAGFMEAGSAIGYAVAATGNNVLVATIGFFLGFTVIFAEPAVYVLNEQIQDVTSGHIKKPVILYTLSIGVALAVMLAMLRILIPTIQLWHYLLPGYIIAVTLSHFAPTLFVGIAFDSGGVASGPMTATFILAFAQGVARAVPGANVLLDAFGVIAMVALTPLIAIQTLGLVYERKSGKRELN